MPHSNWNKQGVLLAVIRFGNSPTCVGELTTALQRGIPTIVMVEPSRVSSLPAIPSMRVIVIDPCDPTAAERQMFDYLRAIDAEQSTKTALIALGTVALGLLLFAHQDA